MKLHAWEGGRDRVNKYIHVCSKYYTHFIQANGLSLTFCNPSLAILLYKWTKIFVEEKEGLNFPEPT